MREHKDQWEFYHKSVGWELHNLPNIPIKVFPLVDTTLHALADASIDNHLNDTEGLPGTPWTAEQLRNHVPKINIVVPQWVFKVKHTGGWRCNKRSPKVSVYLDGGKHICFNFRVSSRPVYKNLEEVFKDLSFAAYELASVNLSARANIPMDEETAVRRFNEIRLEELKNRNAVPVIHPPDLSNVLDLEEIRKRMVPILSSEEVYERLPLYGS